MLFRIINRQFRSSTCLLRSSTTEDKSTILKDLLDNSATFEDINKETPDNDWATLPYPDGTVLRRDQSQKVQRPKIDPKETSIILFPGQGAQYVGMAHNLVKFPAARDIFALANDVLK